MLHLPGNIVGSQVPDLAREALVRRLLLALVMLGAMIGTYQVKDKIGEGGMATVYRAEHPLIGRRVAIKVLHPHLATQGELVARFFQEARVQAMIAHPGLVEVFDFGHHEPSRSNYIVMEHLVGRSLEALLGEHGRLHWRGAAELARGVANAAAAAHRHDVVHRDLKPANLLLITDPASALGMRPKVLDFGVAKLASGSMRTQAPSLLGTPRYMAPEQCLDASRVDARADVYALGCVLYEMVCGRSPFAGRHLSELIAAHLTAAPMPPTWACPDLPPALEWIILRALAKRPEDRISSMAELAALLAQVTAS